jgi:hypothetical protein
MASLFEAIFYALNDCSALAVRAASAAFARATCASLEPWHIKYKNRFRTALNKK